MAILQRFVCASVCPWLTLSAATSPVNEFKLWVPVLRPGFILQNEHSLLQLQSLACGPGRLSSVESLLALSSFCVIGSNELSIQVCAENIGSPQNIGKIQKNQLIAALQVYMLPLFFPLYFQILIVFAPFACVPCIISVMICVPPCWMLNPVSPWRQVCHLSVVQFEHFSAG